MLKVHVAFWWEMGFGERFLGSTKYVKQNWKDVAFSMLRHVQENM
jgi:hypothetical protein